jgi:hypothetical protein
MADSEQVGPLDHVEDDTHTDDSAPRRRPGDMLAPGESLGRYRIAEVLGGDRVKDRIIEAIRRRVRQSDRQPLPHRP